MKQTDWVDLQRLLAVYDRQIAELFAKRAQVLDELADGEAHPRTGRRKQRANVPTPRVAVSETDRARAEKALRELFERRRKRGL